MYALLVSSLLLTLTCAYAAIGYASVIAVIARMVQGCALPEGGGKLRGARFRSHDGHSVNFRGH